MSSPLARVTTPCASTRPLGLLPQLKAGMPGTGESAAGGSRQGLTLVHFPAQLEPLET